MIEIKITGIFNQEILDFLVFESFKLFLKLKGYSNASEDQKKAMMETLKQMYIEQISENQIIYVAYNNNEIVGCAYITNNYINDLFIKEEYRRKKIGTLLLNRIIKDYGQKQLIFDTYPENLEFFKKHGFSVIEENSDCIKMQR